MKRIEHKYTGDERTAIFIECARELLHSWGKTNNLRECNAKIYWSFNEKLAILKSYNTVVAIAYIPDSYCVDFSRIVRCERITIPNADSLPMPMANSRTTSQHISKFCKDLNINTLYAVYPTKDYPEYIRKWGENND